MPRKHIQSAKTNNSSWPGMLIWLTIVPQHLYGKQAVKDWMMAPRGVPAYIHFKHQSGGQIKTFYKYTLHQEAVCYTMYSFGKWQMSVLIYSISPTWHMHSLVGHAQYSVIPQARPTCLPKQEATRVTGLNCLHDVWLSETKMMIWMELEGSQRWHDTDLSATVSAAFSHRGIILDSYKDSLRAKCEETTSAHLQRIELLWCTFPFCGWSENCQIVLQMYTHYISSVFINSANFLSSS